MQGTDKEKIDQLIRYIFTLTEQLNLAFSELERKSDEEDINAKGR